MLYGEQETVVEVRTVLSTIFCIITIAAVAAAFYFQPEIAAWMGKY